MSEQRKLSSVSVVDGSSSQLSLDAQLQNTGASEASQVMNLSNDKSALQEDSVRPTAPSKRGSKRKRTNDEHAQPETTTTPETPSKRRIKRPRPSAEAKVPTTSGHGTETFTSSHETGDTTTPDVMFSASESHGPVEAEAGSAATDDRSDPDILNSKTQRKTAAENGEAKQGKANRQDKTIKRIEKKEQSNKKKKKILPPNRRKGRIQEHESEGE